VALILLDTNAYSALKRGAEDVGAMVRAAETIVMPTVVVGELLYGFRRGSRYERNLRELRSFLARPFVRLAIVDGTTADRYARIAAGLHAKGKPIPSNDMWIAASAMECGAELISYDAHFEHVDGLPWVCPAPAP
jgi:tRNA(fMet)-specific endonuclease VapC